MYTKPVIYRIFSIFCLASGIFSFLASVTLGIIYACMGTIGKLSDFFLYDYLPSELSSAFSVSSWILSTAMFFCAVISLFFSYVEFSSFFQFADLINHDLSNNNEPIRKRRFVMPPKAYKNFGVTIFTIYFVLGIIAAVILVISQSIASKVFVAVPLIPIALVALDLAVVYITYFMRNKAFGDALEIAMDNNQSNPSAATKESLKENKTGMLRAWCTVLFICCILFTILIVVGIILIVSYLPKELHAILIISIIPCWLATILTNAINGCYFDNLAMMLERKLIKYNLIKNTNKTTKCTNCKATVPGDASYCSSCGTKATR